jgi:(R,R)-butanediol dehydrogenase / meso-butanediol dehydrogenase / diacetyl reductase
MRAAVFHGPRDVRVQTVPDPVADGIGSALVEVRRAALCGTDVNEFVSGPHLVVNPPTVLGHEFVGRLLEPAAGLASGTRVVSGAGVWCGRCRRCREGRTNLCVDYRTLGLTVDGGLAERVAVPVRTLVPVPDDLPDERAVLAQPLAVGLHAVRRAAPREEDVVVLVGAGAIGTFALLGLAEAPHARIVVVDTSDAALDQARAAAPGADLAHPDDVVELVRDITGGRGADVVLETSGMPGSLARALDITARGGRVQAVGLPVVPQELDVARLVLAEIDISTSVAHVCDRDIPAALDLLARRAPALLTHEVHLEDVVEGALEPLSRREVLGKVVVRVSG